MKNSLTIALIIGIIALLFYYIPISQLMIATTHTTTINNYTITYETMPIGTTTLTSSCMLYVNDQTTNDKLSVNYKMETKCSAYGDTIRLNTKINNLDLSEYKTIIIKRTANGRFAGRQGWYTLTSNINDLTYRMGQTTASTTITLNDIYITNDGTSITIKSNEGTTILPNNPNTYLTNTITLSGYNDAYFYSLDYQITDIIVTKNNSTIINTPTQIQQFNFLEWLKELLNKILGIIGVQI